MPVEIKHGDIGFNSPAPTPPPDAGDELYIQLASAASDSISTKRITVAEVNPDAGDARKPTEHQVIEMAENIVACSELPGSIKVSSAATVLISQLLLKLVRERSKSWK